MKTCSILLVLLGIPPCVGEELTAKGEKIPGWGTAQNPAADCKFSAQDGKLIITVPGSITAHDLSAEIDNLTAPRVVQPLTGDFMVQVKVDGDFQPGGESTQEGRTGYTGAGLVIFADSKNYVRIERASLETGGSGGATPYTNFEIRVDGQLQRIGTTRDMNTESGKPTWLRLEKKGDRILGSMSQDGKTWIQGDPKILESTSWNTNTISAGVAAISTSTKAFTPIYSELTVTQDAAPPKEKTDAKAKEAPDAGGKEKAPAEPKNK